MCKRKKDEMKENLWYTSPTHTHTHTICYPSVALRAGLAGGDLY